MNNHVKIYVKYDDKYYNIKVIDTCTVAHLLIKLRKLIKLEPEHAMFLFFQYKTLVGTSRLKLYPQNKLLTDIRSELKQSILGVEILLENTFGAWSKMFVKAKIECLNGVYCSIITYSYYGVYHFDEVNVHKTMVEATEHLLKVRCNGCLSLETEK